MNTDRFPVAAVFTLVVVSFVFIAHQPARGQTDTSPSESPDIEQTAEEGSDTVPQLSTCGEEGCLFPQANLFNPLIADPKQPRFFASFLDFQSGSSQFSMGSVGYGEDFGLVRWGDASDSGALQLGILGGLFAQFNLDARSNDLINADYTIGFPLEYRYGNFSVRSRLYHQSSHLGDEFLLSSDTDRINLSFESLELLGSYEISDWRAYGGGEYLVHRTPEDLDRPSVHAGLEYIGGEGLGDMGTLVGGIDYKSFKEHDWDPDYSLRIGVELHRPDNIKRHIRVLLEAYDGHSPFGQFYDNKIEYVGIGMHLGL
jgi:hypothetical protein